MKICIAAGTRPEAIKLAPVHKAALARPGWRSIWIASGQHAAMQNGALKALGVEADILLDLPPDTESLAGRLSHMISQFDASLAVLKPDLVVVQGDTSTTMAGAMAAFCRRIPVAHVEAGLRTFDLEAPFPEEGWRTLVADLATLHFAPTKTAASNLRRQGVKPSTIHVTGNTVIDALKSLPERPTPFAKPGRRLVTATLHRRENWDHALDRVLAGLLALRDRFDDVDIVFVAHANPQLARRVKGALQGQRNVAVSDPLGYADFVALMRASTVILSDSGGVQEEAPAFGVPVLVLREATERVEAIEAGVARLVGTDPARMLSEVSRLLTDREAHQAMARAVNPYGEGQASNVIVDLIARWGAKRGITTPASSTAAKSA